MENDKKNESGTLVRKSTVLTSFFVFLLAFILALGVWIYFYGPQNPLIEKIAMVIPYPAAIVGNKTVSAYDLQKNLDAAVNFYQNQDFSDAGIRVDFSTPDGKKRERIKERRILTKMIEDSIIEQEAQSRGIKLSDAEISSEVKKKMEELGDADTLKKNLDDLYGWNENDFQKYIVKPDLYAQKLYENMRANDSQFTEAKAKINQAWSELNSSKDFESVVGKYSEGDSVKNRGDLGWFSQDEMLPEIAQAISGLEKGQTSGIIESGLGFHIVRVEEKKTENNVDKFHIRQIFVRVPTLSGWLSQKEKEIRIMTLLNGYKWDGTIGEVQFSNNDLKQFEDNLQKNSPDDISVIF